MKNFNKIVFSFLAIITIAFGANAAEVEVGNQAEVYLGPKLERITIVRYGPASNNEALVFIEGVDNPANLQVIKHRVNKSANKTEYTVTADGTNWTTVALDKNNQGEVTLKDMTTFPVTYSREESAKVEPLHIRTRYEQQGTK